MATDINTNINTDRDPEKFFFCVGEDKQGNLRISCSYDSKDCEKVFDDRVHCEPMGMEEVGYAIRQMVKDFDVLDEFAKIVDRIQNHDAFSLAGYDGTDINADTDACEASGEVVNDEPQH